MRHDLTDEEWQALEPFVPTRWRSARVDDRRIVNAIFHVLRTGIPWRDLPTEYGPYTTAYNRFNRWSMRGVWQRMFECYAAKSRDPLAMIDSSAVKAHRAASGAKGGKRNKESGSAEAVGRRRSMRRSMAKGAHSGS